MQQSLLKTIPSRDLILSNKRQQHKLSWKRKEMVQMLTDLKEFFADRAIFLPASGKDAQENIIQGMIDYGYDIISAHEFVKDYEDLIKMYYTLDRSKYALYAQFTDIESKQKDYMLLSCWYSRHRLDSVWLWRKSQLIRKAYRGYLENNYALLKDKTPTHLVLTMPHKDGLYQGKRFYARELLAAFHEMRRSPYWKSRVFGGEYGIEVKKSKKNGLHIHCHSLCYLKEEVSVNEFREWCRARWHTITGAFMIHCETLYYYEKDAAGRSVMVPKKKKNQETGQYEFVYTAGDKYNTHYWDSEQQTFVETEAIQHVPVMVRKKKYITSKSTMDEYLRGILECIKYHFKTDTYKDAAGNWDFELMNEIMSQSQRLRFYSRYGAFYKEETLSFNYEQKQRKEAEKDQDIEFGSSAVAELNMVNPFTGDSSPREDYDIVIGQPGQLEYSGKTTLRPYSILNKKDPFRKIRDDCSLTEIIAGVSRGLLSELLEGSRFEHITAD